MKRKIYTFIEIHQKQTHFTEGRFGKVRERLEIGHTFELYVHEWPLYTYIVNRKLLKNPSLHWITGFRTSGDRTKMSVLSVLFEISPLLCAAIFTLLSLSSYVSFYFKSLDLTNNRNVHILPYISVRDNCENLLIGIVSIPNFTI